MNILFICTGNTCRSPMAEALAAAAFEKHGKTARFSSAGLAAYAGQPASNNAIIAAADYGLSLTGHSARQATREMLARADIILAMSKGHKDQIFAIWPEYSQKTFTLMEYAFKKSTDVADPFGCDAGTYRQCAAQINEAVEKIAEDM